MEMRLESNAELRSECVAHVVVVVVEMHYIHQDGQYSGRFERAVSLEIEEHCGV